MTRRLFIGLSLFALGCTAKFRLVPDAKGGAYVTTGGGSTIRLPSLGEGEYVSFSIVEDDLTVYHDGTFTTLKSGQRAVLREGNLVIDDPLKEGKP